jgi:putative Mg2+ transporter-C (MgtC) family protein
MEFGGGGAGDPQSAMMTFDYDFIYDNSVKLLVSLVLGALIGAEREYKGRNVGFRTIILITLGSTLFTILSFILGEGNDPSRIASNIVTGVGFLGAGAIFREGASVRGVTTASIIWISAAIGMACGIAQYEFAVMVTTTTLVVLVGFAGVQKFIDKYNKEMIYRVTILNDPAVMSELEKRITAFGLKYDYRSHTKVEKDMVIEYEVRGSESGHNQMIRYLCGAENVKNFNV